MNKSRIMGLSLAVIAMLCSPLSAEETLSDRPQRFLMLFKPGDKISWLPGSEMNGYHVTIYSAEVYQETIKRKHSRDSELNSLREQFNGKIPGLDLKDLKSNDPDVLRRAKDIERFQRLVLTTPKVQATYGEVVFVGTDYIAVVADGAGKEETLIPAWTIVRIGKETESRK